MDSSWQVTATAWAVPVLDMTPLADLSFLTALPSLPWYWCLDVGGCGRTVMADTCSLAPSWVVCLAGDAVALALENPLHGPT